MAKDSGETAQDVTELAKSVTDGRLRIAAAYVDRVIEYVENKETKIEGTPLLVQYGIAQDKYDKGREQPTIDNRQLVIVIPGLNPQTIKIDAPDTIDADAIPLPEQVRGDDNEP